MALSGFSLLLLASPGSTGSFWLLLGRRGYGISCEHQSQPWPLRSRAEPGRARGSQEELGGARKSLEEAGRASRARRSQEGSRRARKSHEEQGGTRKRQRELRNTLIYEYIFVVLRILISQYLPPSGFRELRGLGLGSAGSARPSANTPPVDLTPSVVP